MTAFVHFAFVCGQPFILDLVAGSDIIHCLCHKLNYTYQHWCRLKLWDVWRCKFHWLTVTSAIKKRYICNSLPLYPINLQPTEKTGALNTLFWKYTEVKSIVRFFLTLCFWFYAQLLAILGNYFVCLFSSTIDLTL